MNENYKISSMAFPLSEICAVKVAQKVIEASRVKLSRIDFRTWLVEMEARRRVRKLEIPRAALKLVKSYIGPMIQELGDWKPVSFADLVWTPQGTVDRVQSVNAILANKNIYKLTRLDIACDHSYEEIIFKIFNEENIEHWKPKHHLAEFWREAWRDGFAKWDLKLCSSRYNYGFRLAVYTRNEAAVRYFVNKASIDGVRSFLVSCEYFVSRDTHFKPDTYCMLFSKLSVDQQQKVVGAYTFALLNSLLCWPYQRFFPKAALKLVSHLSYFDYWYLLREILERAVSSYTAYNYYLLFVELGELCNIRWQRGCIDDEYVRLDVVTSAFLTMNKHVVNFLLRVLSTKAKEQLLMNTECCKICSELLDREEFGFLEVFIRGCGMHSEAFLITFKDAYLKNCARESEIRFWSVPMRWDAAIESFTAIVDKLIAEKSYGNQTS